MLRRNSKVEIWHGISVVVLIQYLDSSDILSIPLLSQEREREIESYTVGS